MLFEKEKHSLDILSPLNWGNELIRLRTRIADVMSNPPPKVKPCASSFVTSKITKSATQTVSEHELRCFVEASEKMETDEQNTEMMRIMKELQPELLESSSHNWFDVSKLELSTFNALRTYVKAQLEQKGEKYPE